MSHYNKVLVELIVALALIIAIIAAAFTIFGRQAHGEGVTYCAERPGGGREWWLYRIIDGRKCWFPAQGLHRGQEKPREHLRWQPKPVIEDPPKPMAKEELIEEEPPPKLPTQFELRWGNWVEILSGSGSYRAKGE